MVQVIARLGEAVGEIGLAGGQVRDVEAYTRGKRINGMRRAIGNGDWGYGDFMFLLYCYCCIPP